MIDHLSSSQINLYLRCSLKYKFQYLDELPKLFKSSGLVFGSVIHSSIEWLHKERIAGREVSLEKLYRIFDADWYAQKVDSDIRYKDGESEAELVHMAREMLSLYFHAQGKKAIGAEVLFTVPLISPLNGGNLGIPLEGIFDLLEEDDVIVEFKTSSKTIDPQDPNYYIQLTAYSYAYEMLYRKRPKLLKIVGFVKNKKPKIVVKETQRDKEDYQRLFYLAREVLKGINSRIFFPLPSFCCNDCEYEEPCRAWKGN